MSLKNQPEFEAETMTTAEVQGPAPTEAAAAEGATAIAKASSTAVTTPSSKFSPAFAAQKDIFDTPTVSGLSLSSPRLKGEQGSIFDGQTELGSRIRVEIVSWNHRWAIGTGTDDKEAKDHFRVSYDNKVIDGDEGTTVLDYIEGLKAQGYPKAKSSPYIDLWCFVTWTEKGGDVAAEKRALACVQCSQTSAGAFTGFCVSRGLLESKGLVKPLTEVEIQAEKRAKGTNKYTNFSFHAPA